MIRYCRAAIACGAAFPLRFGDRIRRLNRLSAGNRLRAFAIGSAFDLCPPAADLVLARLGADPVQLDALLASPRELEAHLRQNIAGVFHPAGTCRMGTADDPAAVTDAEGRVYGVENLRVADASIMPNVIAGNTNIPTIMLAEKIAAGMNA
jgi:5-(hydroxymethyl)furfural/furfural oxidase